MKRIVFILQIFISVNVFSSEVIFSKLNWGFPFELKANIIRTIEKSGSQNAINKLSYTCVFLFNRNEQSLINVSVKSFTDIKFNDITISDQMDSNSILNSMIISQPSFIINSSGEFISLQTNDSMKAGITQVGKQLNIDKLAELTIDEATRALLESKISQEWMFLVQNWTDTSMDIGNEYEINDFVTLPILSDTPISLIQKIKLNKIDQRNNAYIEFNSYPDPNEVVSVLREISKNNFDESSITEFVMKNKINVITNYLTLIPNCLTIEKITSAKLNNGSVTSRKEVISYNFIND